MKAKIFSRFSFAGVATIFFVLLTAQLSPVNAKTFPVLAAPSDAGDEGHNAEGMKHYNKGHWEKAEQHFKGAIKADPKLAEAHYNLALSLDKMGNHGAATDSFERAFKLAPKNPSIAGSKILKGHLGM